MESVDTLISKELTATLKADRHLRDVISRIVPAKHATHLLFCRINHQCLHLTLDTAAWITRLRYSERQLLEALRQEGFVIHRVRWHVSRHEDHGNSHGARTSTASTEPARKPRPARPPLAAAASMRQLAREEASVQGRLSGPESTASQQLQRAFERLAVTLERKAREP